MSGPTTPPPSDVETDPPDLPGEEVGTTVEDGEQVQWRRVHRITPVLNAWKVAAVLLGITVWNQGDELAQLPLPVVQKALIVVGVIVLGAVIGLAYSAIAWRRTQYGIGEESIFLHSGVLWRQQRHVRLDRLQSVDVTQPLLARLFGFSSLKIESAGGAGSNLTLSYLTDVEAQRVRNEILARAAGVRRTTPAASTDGSPAAPPVDAEAAPERPLLELSGGRLIHSLVRSMGVVVAVLLLVAVVVVIVVTQTFQFVAGALPGVLGAAGYVWSRFAGEFSYRIAISADGIRLRHGLLEAKTRTVPPGRVQAISLSQPPLWRGKDWWRIRMNVAGYGGETEDSVSVLFPVATTAEVQQILPLVIPDLGADRPLDVLHAGLTGSGGDEDFVTSPERARIFDPFTWRRNGIRVTRTAVLLRSGRWWRYLALVPHERTQSLAMSQGPLERRRRLAGLDLHSTSGPVLTKAIHLDVEVARGLLLEQAERARGARRSAGPERWMSGTGRTGDPVPPVTGVDVPADAVALRSGYGGVLPTAGTR